MEIISEGITIFYEKQGEGAPLVLLHGNGEEHGIFDELAEVLSKDFTVYALDSRCHGKSGNGKLGYEEMASDVYTLITALGLQKPIVCGFSDGGIIALALASAHPASVGAIIACGANTEPRGLKLWFRIVCGLGYLFCRSRYLKLMLCEPHLSAERLGKITAPTLVLAGKHDIIAQSHTCALTKSVHGAEQVILKGESHGSYVVHKTTLAPIIKDFAFRKGLCG